MQTHEIQKILMNALPVQEVYVSNSGSCFQIIVVSEAFNGMNRVQKQQFVYTPLMKYITNNCIHALSIKTYTPQEWKHNYKFSSF